MDKQEIKDIINAWTADDKENRTAFVVLVEKEAETEGELRADAAVILNERNELTKSVLKDIVKNATGGTARVQQFMLEITLESFIELINKNKED